MLKLIVKTVLKSVSLMSFFRINAPPNPESIKIYDIPINRERVPISPKSVGLRILARIIVSIKTIPL